jgi:hypothetical protein
MSLHADLLPTEIQGWFPTEPEDAVVAVICKWMAAEVERSRSPDVAVATDLWSKTCALLRTTHKSTGFVLAMLDGYIDALKRPAAIVGGSTPPTLAIAAAVTAAAAPLPAAAVIAETRQGVFPNRSGPGPKSGNQATRAAHLETMEQIILEILKCCRTALKTEVYARMKPHFQFESKSLQHNGPSRTWQHLFPSPEEEYVGPIQAVSLDITSPDSRWVQHGKVQFRGMELTTWYEPSFKLRFHRHKVGKTPPGQVTGFCPNLPPAPGASVAEAFHCHGQNPDTANANAAGRHWANAAEPETHSEADAAGSGSLGGWPSADASAAGAGLQNPQLAQNAAETEEDASAAGAGDTANANAAETHSEADEAVSGWWLSADASASDVEIPNAEIEAVASAADAKNDVEMQPHLSPCALSASSPFPTPPRSQREREGTLKKCKTSSETQTAATTTCGTCNALLCPQCWLWGFPDALLDFFSLLRPQNPQVAPQIPCPVCLPGIEVFDEALNCFLDGVYLILRDGIETVKTTRDQRLQSSLVLVCDYVGLLFAAAMEEARLHRPEDVRAMLLILEFEIENGIDPSVRAWDALMVKDFDNAFVLRITKACAASFTKGRFRKRHFDDALEIEGAFSLAVVSADFGDNHPAAHLLQSVLCDLKRLMLADDIKFEFIDLASPATIEENSMYRNEAKKSFGKDFKKMGKKSDTNISHHIRRFTAVLLLGCGHQYADRPSCIFGAKDDKQVFFQWVGHAGATGHPEVDYFIGDRITLGGPSEFGSEKQLALDGSFFPNSYVEHYFHLVDELLMLGRDKSLCAKKRREYGLPVEGLLMVNISKANRMDRDFFEMVMTIMEGVPKAFLVLIRHNLLAERRIKEHFAKRCLEGRLIFLDPILDDLPLLFRVLALCDLGLDTLVYSGHTAGADILFALGILCTVKGERVCQKVGASLATAFGTPELVYSTPADLAAKVIWLLTEEGALMAQREKGHGLRRTDSLFFNMSKKAENLLTTIKTAVSKHSEHCAAKRAEIAALMVLSPAELAFKEEEVASMTHQLELMGINVLISSPQLYPTEPRWFFWPAEFRRVSVHLLLFSGRDMNVVENPVFNEICARAVLSKGSNPKFFDQFLSQLMPFDETTATGDALRLLLPNGETVYALLVEASDGFASEIFDGLADRVKRNPLAPPASELLQVTQAFLSILAAVHGKGVADVCDPRGWTFSKDFKDGHGVTSVAYAPDTGGSPSALFLGLMCRAQIDGKWIHSEMYRATRRSKSNAQTDLAGHGTVRARLIQENAAAKKITPPVRASARLGVSRCYVTLGEMSLEAEEFSKCPQSYNSALPSGHPSCRVGELARTKDLKKLAASLIGALRGGRGDDYPGGDPPHLLRHIWQNATPNDFVNKFGLSPENVEGLPSMVDSFWRNNFSQLPNQEQALINVVCTMLSEGASAKSLLEHRAFRQDAMGAPLRKSHIEGSDSITQDSTVHAICPQIFENLQEKTQHYYVAGSKSEFTGEKVSLGIWLVYDLRADQVPVTGQLEWYRSLFLGQAGQAGAIVGRYKNDVYSEDQLTHMEKRWLLYLPGRGHAMDGHCRGRGDAPRLVQEGNVACFANSAKGTSTCRREWYPDRIKFTANKTIGRPVKGCMVLLLKHSEAKYTELTYTYEYDKEEKRAKTAVKGGIAAALSHQWGGPSSGYGLVKGGDGGGGGGLGGRGGGGGSGRRGSCGGRP